MVGVWSWYNCPKHSLAGWVTKPFVASRPWRSNAWATSCMWSPRNGRMLLMNCRCFGTGDIYDGQKLWEQTLANCNPSESRSSGVWTLSFFELNIIELYVLSSCSPTNYCQTHNVTSWALHQEKITKDSFSQYLRSINAWARQVLVNTGIAAKDITHLSSSSHI